MGLKILRVKLFFALAVPPRPAMACLRAKEFSGTIAFKSYRVQPWAAVSLAIGPVKLPAYWLFANWRVTKLALFRARFRPGMGAKGNGCESRQGI